MELQQLDWININWKKIFHVLKKKAIPIAQELNITKVDSNILLALLVSPEKTKAQLAESLSFEPNSLTRSIDRLVERGAIHKKTDSEDKRYIKLSLTQNGERLAMTYCEAMRAIWRELLIGVNEDETNQLDIALNRIVEKL